MRGPLDDVALLLSALWAAGSGHPDPELRRDLRPLADEVAAQGAARLAEGIRALAEALEAGDHPAAFAAQLQVWVRLRGLRRGLAAQDLRDRLAAGPEVEAPPAVGWTGAFHPLGALVVPPLVHVHGVDDDGGWRTFSERAVQVDSYDPFGSPWISRIFQAELTLGSALQRRWEVRDHPGVSTARRWVGKPAFHVWPTLGRKRPEGVDLPALSVSERLGIGRAEVVAQREGGRWAVRCGGRPVRTGPCLELNLDKLAAVEGGTVRREAVVLAASQERVVLQWGEPPCFPTLDPRACRWSPEGVRRRATGGWGAVLRGLLGARVGVDPAAALSSMDGFPLPTSLAEGGGEGDPEAMSQAFWRQWVALGLGRAPAVPVPSLVAALRGAAAGEAVGAERLLQALWTLEHAGGLEGERAVIAQVAATRPAAGEGDVIEAVLQARLARHGGVGASGADAEARRAHDARVEEEASALLRRLGQVGVVPELPALFWLGDAVAEARQLDRRRGVGLLGIEAEALDRAVGARVCRWIRRGSSPGEGEVLAWAVAEGGGRTDVFLGRS